MLLVKGAADKLTGVWCLGFFPYCFCVLIGWQLSPCLPPPSPYLVQRAILRTMRTR